MVELQPDVVTQADLIEWYKLKEELGKLKAKEGLLRSRIFKFYFPAPVEGMNKVPTNDGTGGEIKGTHKINRTVDPASLDGLKDELAQEGYNGPLLKLDELIKYTPELVLSAYRTLTEEERLFFDRALIIKDGSPELKIEVPKKGAKAK